MSFRDECGVFGIFGHPEAANLVYLGLYALQHRGQESAGIVSSDGTQIYRAVGMGQVADVFPPEALKRLKGSAAAGHVRYSTSGSSHLVNAQPIAISYHSGEIAVGHNGNLVNAARLRTQLEREGSIFQSTSDTEVILHLIARSPYPDLEDAITHALKQVEGAYSVVFLTRDRVVAVRDPRGFRPLSLGQVEGAWCVASESCAFDLIGARFVRDVAPGEMVVLDAGGVRSLTPFPPAPVSQCVFEYVYFARPDSLLFGQGVQSVRKRMGARLADEHPVTADIVVPVPDSGVYAALGYAERSGIPFEMGLVRNHYVGRTFIEPKQSIRHFGVKVKLNPVRDLLTGKKVVLVDDSIVRGTTSRKIVSMIKEAGAKEVHVRISCPPTVGPCYYGVDTPNRSELIASSHNVDEIRKYIRASSLGYLSLEGMKAAVAAATGPAAGAGDPSRFCNACYTLNYPVPLSDEDVAQLPLFQKSKR